MSLEPDWHPSGGSVPEKGAFSEKWLLRLEKWRDPSHGRLLSASASRRIPETSQFKVLQCWIRPLKQPDLEWYFRTAGTRPGIRREVLDLAAGAPEEARHVASVAEEEENVGLWPWVNFLVRRPEVAKSGRQT